MAWITNREVRDLVDDLHHKTLVEIAELIIAKRDELAERDETISGLEAAVARLDEQVAELTHELDAAEAA